MSFALLFEHILGPVMLEVKLSENSLWVMTSNTIIIYTRGYTTYIGKSGRRQSEMWHISGYYVSIDEFEECVHDVIEMLSEQIMIFSSAEINKIKIDLWRQ